MKIKLNGTTRIVFLIGKYAVKIPNFIYQHNHFLQGCYANWSERHYTKHWRLTGCDLYSKIAPTVFCTWFGLFAIQKRVEPRAYELSIEEIESFSDLTTDIKKENFGYLGERFVCVDYV